MSDPPEVLSAPLLRVLTGSPTEEELAALVAVLAARAGSAGTPEQKQRPSTWSAPIRLMRAPLYAGSDGWRRSGLPH